MNNEIECWSCEGKGVMKTTAGVLPCFRCKERGKVPAEMLQWALDGGLLRSERLAKRISLREHCRQSGEDIRERSNRELGLIDP